MNKIQFTSSKALEIIDTFLEKIYYKQLQIVSESGNKSLVIDFNELDKFNPDLSDFLLEEPLQLLKLFNKCLMNFDLTHKDLTVRFNNLPERNKIKIRDLRSNHISVFISIEGVIKTSSEVRPVAKTVIFECMDCSREIIVTQDGNKMNFPTSCNCGRKNGFKIIKENFIDTVRITLEESPETLEGGEQPKRITCYLEGDLVNPKKEKDILPGNKVRIIGILKEYPVLLNTGGRSTRYDLLIQTNNLESIEKDFEEILINKSDVVEIEELAKNDNVYELLSQSITPTVLGYGEIKKSLSLLIFGGVRKVKYDGTSVRGDIHLLLVGDPGVGKSMMLTYMSKLAPKAIYVTGKGTSAAGLTATVIKDEFTKDWLLEAGALVLANKGIAIIDELDKMNHEDRVSMHEAMAQQTVTINKANIHATLNAQCSILAAANPSLGRFNPYDSISKQINLPPTLINRFDLIFPIRDIPEPKKDELIARHILEHHMSLEKPDNLIDKELLRKYVAYAKQICKPTLSNKAMHKISDFYVKLRNKRISDEKGLQPIPITARQLDSLIRLTEASARIQLRTEADENDANRAIDLLQFSMKEVGIDPETGEFDIDRLTTGTTTTQRNRILIISQVIDKLSEELGEMPLQLIIEKCESKGVEKHQIKDIVNKMLKNGELFNPRHDIYKKTN